GGAVVDLGNSTAQVVNSNLTLTLPNPLGIANIIGSATFDDQITGNTRDNQITVGQGTDILSGGGGHDTYYFTGSHFDAGPGPDIITDSSATSSDALNFLGFGAPISLNLSVAANTTQTISGTSQLKLVDPLAFTTVVGTSFNDAIKGNSRNNTLLGAGGQDTVTAGNGKTASSQDLLQGGITQVVYLDFTSHGGLGAYA